LKASELGLVGAALQAALDFEATFPSASFTSGRRSLEDQARAMAQNVWLNEKWIAQTYLQSPASTACQLWVDDVTKPVTAEQIEVGLLSVLEQFNPMQLAHLSKHLSGEAFDVQPCDDNAQKIWLYVRAARLGGKFLEKEGGLTRWHLQL
jgi:hypothetical protein